MGTRSSGVVRRLLLAFALGGAAALTSFTAGLAQQGPTFAISDGVVNGGGHATPLSGGLHRLTRPVRGSVGEGALGARLSSRRFSVEGGFLVALRPPTEVDALRLTGPATLTWAGESSSGTYNVYRSRVDLLPADYGACLASGVTTTSASDATPCPSGRAFFYLVTAVNRLGEEGTRGADSRGVERSRTTPCP